MSSNEFAPQPDAKGDDDNRNQEGGDFDRMLAKLDKHLVALKSVREPGRGRLTVGEAVRTALAQAAAYEHWRQFGAPGGVIEVWVEEQRVMALHPGDATDLQGVLFEAAGMPKAVVQVVRRADEIADTVVLLNRELRDVLHNGGRCEQRHPNNRHVTLEVKREGRGQFSFWVGFNQPSEVPAGGLGILEQLKGKAARAWMRIRARAGRLKEGWGVPEFQAAAAVLALTLCAIITLPSRKPTGTFAAARPPEAAPMVKIAAATNEGLAPPVILVAAKTEGADAPGAGSKLPAARAPVAFKPAARTGTARRPRLAPARVEVVAPKDEQVAHDGDAATLAALPDRRGAVAAEPSAWEAQRLRRLAEVQRVVLKVEDTTALNKEQADDLLASIKEALSGMGVVVLTDETEKRPADGFMLLRFEPDTTLLGAIFATMRDRDGNFLWDDYAGCRTLPGGGGWGATFDDASARLVSKLPLKKVASKHDDAKSQSVIGSKYERSLVRRPPAEHNFMTGASKYGGGRMSVNRTVNYERD